MDTKDYDKLKEALLRRFRLTEAGFRDRFRYSKPEINESFSQYVTRISCYLDRWIELGKTPKTFDGLRELVIKEQALNMCNKDLKLFIQERNPGDLAAMNETAEQYLEVHGKLYRHWHSHDHTRSERCAPQDR